jgi:hypothetical protein
VRYEKSVFDLLERQKITGAVVDIRIGVGDRVVFVDLVKEHGDLRPAD